MPKITTKTQVTEFQSRVYELTKQIPKGYVTTYAELAKKMKCKSSQAVGQALKRNPFAPEVPCHRVIASTLTIGGFFGQKGSGDKINKKLQLLREEGVEFDEEGKLADKSKLYKFQ
eukprot:GEZU01015762.1.p1 GENE.GEZU01015762.1~~GEZU01015762.1.p1  ORF type:complete len:116 (-),score=30.84 GEZU01015762.1:24-371(-)